MPDEALDTIFARATGEMTAAIAVIRLSGPRSHDAIRTLTKEAVPRPGQMALRRIIDAADELIDRSMVVVFGERSFTGETSAEIQCHGGRAVVDAVLSELSRLDGLRPALPGEFTRRAVMNGRMDLTAAQGLSDLIAAETSAQRRMALETAEGGLFSELEKWRANLIRARALVETTIDWADEDVPEDVSPEVTSLIAETADAMKDQIAAFSRTERLRTGFEVALLGAPNVGKSTLLNQIAGRPVAITSAIAGTTRDVIEAQCDLDGLPVRFLDMAGIRESNDEIEREGISRAIARARAADLRVFVISKDAPCLNDLDALRLEGDLIVANKSDLGIIQSDVAVSALDGTGIDALLSTVRDHLKTDPPGLLAHQVQRDAVERSLRLVDNARCGIPDAEVEVLADLLRAAIAEIDGLSGRDGLEETLDVVFSSFCIGK